MPGRSDAVVHALAGVDLELAEGSFTAVVGASGSGKSTLLQCVAGLDRPSSGTVHLLGTQTTSLRPGALATFRAKHMGVIFQEDNLVTALSARDNVVLPGRLRRRPLSRGDVDAALEVLGILAVLNDALRRGALDDVREELFQVRYFLQNTRDLRVRLSDLRLGDEHERGDLASAVFASRVSPWTMRLIRRAVGRSHHGRLLHNLRRYAAWAATMQDRLFVTVATAHPMSGAQVERLRSILSKRFGAEIDLAISIDPDVIGGFVLRAGSTAVDATVRTRLADARARIAV